MSTVQELAELTQAMADKVGLTVAEVGKPATAKIELTVQQRCLAASIQAIQLTNRKEVI